LLKRIESSPNYSEGVSGVLELLTKLQPELELKKVKKLNWRLS
jgi:hypothetical protein